MRIAIFSDIHANLVALEAILSDLQKMGAERLVCLGDVAASGPQPHEVVQRLMGLEADYVMGNADAWALAPQVPDSEDEDTHMLQEIMLWGANCLTPEDKTFLASFRPVAHIDGGEGSKLLACHGSPRSYSEGIRATTPDLELEEMLADVSADIVACAHTHTPMLRRFGAIRLINPGSVGLPFVQTHTSVRNPLWAEYALLEGEGDSQRIEFRRTPVDFERLKEATLKSGMPHADFWIRDWF